jgi:phage-related protein
MTARLKPLVFVGPAKRELCAFPETVIHEIGLTLLRVQYGDKPPSAKPLHGFGGAGVLEVIENDDGNTYRAVYTVKFAGRVYVLHAFQKKSKSGRATPQNHLELIHRRLDEAERIHRAWVQGN